MSPPNEVISSNAAPLSSASAAGSTGVMDVRSLTLALQHSQLQNQELEAENKQLKLSATTQSPSPPASANATASESTSTKESWQDAARRAGSAYAHMHCPWGPSSYEGSYEAAQVTNPYNPLRYTNDALRTNCAFAELFTVIPKTPEHLRFFEENNPKYPEVVQGGVTNGRTKMVQRAKSEAHQIYTSFHAQYPNFFKIRNDPTSRKGNAQACEWLGFDESQSTYATYPPLLYKDFNTAKVSGLYRNVQLMQLAKVLLFGASSLNPGGPAIPTKSTNATLWEVKTTTPGLMVGTGILARFLFSPDASFGKTGLISGISYLRDFETCKRSVIIGIEHEHFQKTFALWNMFVFGAKPAVPPLPAATGDTEDELEELLRAIDDDDSETEEDLPAGGRTPVAAESDPIDTASTLIVIPTMDTSSTLVAIPIVDTPSALVTIAAIETSSTLTAIPSAPVPPPVALGDSRPEASSEASESTSTGAGGRGAGRGGSGQAGKHGGGNRKNTAVPATQSTTRKTKAGEGRGATAAAAAPPIKPRSTQSNAARQAVISVQDEEEEED
ncbi:hypothetical protein V5O48_016109 [Marasmius crinis-equi]|uniref:Uncharacterized protein n=1 Tax=Marasmius crinis-equi TaxID=585013 RepID=A0ABR3ESQ1_9AGAR